jgi:hypothetical protein
MITPSSPQTSPAPTPAPTETRITTAITTATVDILPPPPSCTTATSDEPKRENIEENRAEDVETV